MAWTWNPSDKSGNITLSNGNLTAASNVSECSGARCTSYKSSGKWYWEITLGTATTTGPLDLGVGTSSTSLGARVGSSATGWGWQLNGYYGHNDVFTANGIAAPTSGDIVSVALDLDNGKIWFGKNGTWNGSGDPAAGTNEAFSGVTGNLYPIIVQYHNNSWTANFGASAFTYTVPTGFTGIALIEDSISETATVTDSMEALHLVDEISETATVTDSFDALHLVDEISETATVTDTMARVFEVTKAISETATVTDAFDRNYEVERSISETATVTDVMEPLHLVDVISETATVEDSMVADEMIRKKVRFPNLQGKHLSLKFTSATDGSFAIYYLRHKMFKTRELCSDQKHPNTQGSHIGIKLSNSGSDAFTLMYVSEKMQLVTT
jgi:hypothetical protein